MYEILNTNSDRWNQCLDKFKLETRDIYFTSDYYKLYESNGDGIGKCFFYYDTNGNFALYPFMIRPICGYDLKEKYYDIETAYGYGGPILNCNNSEFINNFEDEFIRYCTNNNIIAEFIRFHPLIKNENIFSKNIEILHNRKTVYVDLTKSIEEIWNDELKSENRTRIRKAIKNGLSIEENKDINNFVKIYNLTMNKVRAADYYYFADKYYECIERNDNCVLLNVKKENKVIASGIFMKYGDYFHYHLGGSLKEYLKFAPNNFLLWEAIKYAQKNGHKKMHFGGGRKDSLDDTLFRFKSTFSKECADFYIGKRIHNVSVYNYLVSEWKQKSGKESEILLRYRIK